MREFLRTSIFIVVLFLSNYVQAQRSSCPDNIGFESGSFSGWNCYGGIMSASTGVTALQGPNPLPNRHTLIQNTTPPQTDPYGNFPISCPNGSGYSIKLGNALVGGHADRVNYTFTVPADRNEYSIIYNYAIVFQNPNHLPEEQPRFTSRVFDENAGEYLSCGSFEFVSTANLPGFRASDADASVFYKPWAPVTVKLYGCAGKRITLEFTVNDCTRGGHFGYAYLDVNENCNSPITGNVACAGLSTMTLTGPFGFRRYEWYDSNFSQLLDTTATLRLQPIPPIGTRFALVLTPFLGIGCPDTLYTTIQRSTAPFQFSLKDTVTGCKGTPANLTLPSITTGSSQGLTFSYHTDSSALQYLGTPTYIVDSGTFFIKAVNPEGCTEVKPITVRFREIPLSIHPPPAACSPNLVDLTAASITAGSDPLFMLTYWADAQATIPLLNPSAIDSSGTYYIRGANGLCTPVAPVTVTVWRDKDFIVNPIRVCSSADLTDARVTTGSNTALQYSYWQDAQATQPLPDPTRVSSSGTYYIKALTPGGCSFIKPVPVTIIPAPLVTVIDPDTVTAPMTVDITTAFSTQVSGLRFGYWRNADTSSKVINPRAVPRTGVYYISATDTSGCAAIVPVNVVVTVPYHPYIQVPNAFSPNGDGVNDVFRLIIAGNIDFKLFRVFNRWGQTVFQTKDPFEFWTGMQHGKPAATGTYYWIVELLNNNDNKFYRRKGSITLLR